MESNESKFRKLRDDLLMVADMTPNGHGATDSVDKIFRAIDEARTRLTAGWSPELHERYDQWRVKEDAIAENQRELGRKRVKRLMDSWGMRGE